MDSEDARIRVESLLRRAGLSGVPRHVLVCAGILCALLVALALVHFWPGGAPAGDFSTTGAGEQAVVAADTGDTGGTAGSAFPASASAGASAAPIAVDVEGAVREPGVYELADGSRVADAVEAAGGLARGASRTSVNLAQKVSDGMQVYVATKKEAAGAGGAAASGAGGTASGAGKAAAGGAAGSGTAAAGGKVNLNTASAEELQTLSGIGPALSQRIIDYRESKGPFKSVEQLKEVSGIGDAKFAAVEDSVCV